MALKDVLGKLLGNVENSEEIVGNIIQAVEEETTVKDETETPDTPVPENKGLSNELLLELRKEVKSEIAASRQRELFERSQNLSNPVETFDSIIYNEYIAPILAGHKDKEGK